MREILDPLLSSLEKHIAIKVIISWKTLLLLKHCRLKQRPRGTEIVCKMCKCMALANVNQKLKILKAQKTKVKYFMEKASHSTG